MVAAASPQGRGVRANAQSVLLTGAKVIDGKGGTPTVADVLIEAGGRIGAVGAGLNVDPGVRQVDLQGHWITPGLVNAHDHLSMKDALTSEENRKAYYNLYRQDPRLQLLRATRGALVSLAAGITSVRDAGAIDQITVELREGINSGVVVGPRLATCGSPLSPPLQGQGVQEAGMTIDAAGPAAVRNAIEELAAKGVDYIKIKGHRRDFSSERTLLYTDEELGEAVEVSHALGLKVTFHAWHPEIVESAVKHGADCVEHGNTLIEGERLAQALADKGIQYVPNIVNWVPDPARHHPSMNSKAAIAKEKVWPSVEACIAAGVAIGVGTDLHTPTMSMEMEALLSLGMSPMEVIGAATLTGARIIGWDNEIGTIEAGKLADLLVLDSDPLADVHAFDQPKYVYLAGYCYRPETLIEAAGPTAFWRDSEYGHDATAR